MLDRETIVASTQLVIDTFRSFRDTLIDAHGNIGHTHKSDYSQVTVLDIAVETDLKNKLSVAYPKIGFYGEETGQSGNSNTYWLVDPIDGTSSFVRGLPFCTNMAALIDDGEAIASVIYNFLTDDLYTANIGSGAFKNGERLQVNETRNPGNLLLYSFSPYKFNELNKILMTQGIKSVYPVGAAGHFYTLLPMLLLTEKSFTDFCLYQKWVYVIIKSSNQRRYRNRPTR